MKKIATALAGIALVITPAAYAKKKPELTPMEIQALQSHEYETTKEVLFASVVSVFQDLGYQLANADVASGFITAASPMKNKTSFLDALASQQGSGNTKVTAFVEQMPGGAARVRLNFVNSKNISGAWGRSSAEDKPIFDTVTYKSAWDKIDEAVFTRTATAAVAVPATPVTAATVAASPQ
ncbi:hypothetical protein [Sphingobium sp.]|uniref:hypothetical protein n=1 Tax=Sphingobium sp. TaxID=1912891 RepID=UPI003BB4D201